MATQPKPRAFTRGRGRDTVPHAGLVKAIKGKRYKPCLMRACAVRAGVIERAKPYRDLTQAQFAAIFMADMRSLRTWTARYLAEGLKGLGARGGQGRRPAVSDEDVARAIKTAPESGPKK